MAQVYWLRNTLSSMALRPLRGPFADDGARVIEKVGRLSVRLLVKPCSPRPQHMLSTFILRLKLNRHRIVLRQGVRTDPLTKPRHEPSQSIERVTAVTDTNRQCLERLGDLNVWMLCRKPRFVKRKEAPSVYGKRAIYHSP